MSNGGDHSAMLNDPVCGKYHKYQYLVATILLLHSLCLHSSDDLTYRLRT